MCYHVEVLDNFSKTPGLDVLTARSNWMLSTCQITNAIGKISCLVKCNASPLTAFAHVPRISMASNHQDMPDIPALLATHA